MKKIHFFNCGGSIQYLKHNRNVRYFTHKKGDRQSWAPASSFVLTRHRLNAAKAIIYSTRDTVSGINPLPTIHTNHRTPYLLPTTTHPPPSHQTKKYLASPISCLLSLVSVITSILLKLYQLGEGVRLSTREGGRGGPEVDHRVWFSLTAQWGEGGG